MSFELRPNPPQWALDAGLPAPRDGETYCAYVERLGLDCDELMVELTERTLPLANSRLAAAIARACPDTFDAYKRARRAAVLPPSHLL